MPFMKQRKLNSNVYLKKYLDTLYCFELNKFLKMKFIKIIILIFTFLLTTNPAFCQINTEVLRTIKPLDGIYHNINLEFGLNKGNTDLFRIRTSYRVDFVDSTDRTFAIINYENAKNNEKDVLNRGFLHFRMMNNFNKFIENEYFYQKEFNDFTRLLDRNVLGSNLRLNILNYVDSLLELKFSFANGLMFENEVINQNYIWKTYLLKSNNYLSLDLNYDKKIYFNTILYFQFAFVRILDRRFLNNTNLSFKINKNISFNMRLSMFYDKEPPPNIQNLDYEIVNGININF